MRIALVRPNLGDYRSSDAMPPLAMGILAARSAGHAVSFFDDRVEELPRGLEADLIAMSVETFTARRSYDLADLFRSRGRQVVMGGHHPTFLPQEALLHADAVVTGDAEGAWEALLGDAERGVLRQVYAGDNSAPLDDCRIDRSVFSGKRYVPIEPVQFGRGCRHRCDFCSIHAFYGSNPRVRPVELLRGELGSLDRSRLVFFVDDNLFSTRENLEALLSLLEPLGLRWCCQMSIDVASDPELLDALARSGCAYILIGFETLEEDNLREMNKPWNRAAGSYTDVVCALHERGIGVYGTFVFGYDHDTPDTIKRALDFALESSLEIANFNPLTPTPGSALYARLRSEGRLLSETWWLDPDYRYGDPIFVPRGMAADELTDGCLEAKKRFYAWSSIAGRLVRTDRTFSLFGTASTTLANVISRREVLRKQGRVLGA